MNKSAGKFNFNYYCRVITIMAVSSSVSPFLYIFLCHSFENPALISAILPFTLVSLGYLMQTLYGRVVKYRRKQQEGGYERLQKYFEPAHAALTISLAVIIGLFSKFFADAYLKQRAEHGFDIYDPNSIYPYFIMLLVIASVTAGIVMWFYPFGKIVSAKSLFSFFAAFVIAFALHKIFSVPNMIFLTLSLVVFVMSAFIILNQSYLLGIVGKSKTGALTDNVRLYNIALVFILLIALALVLVIISIAASGVVITAKMLLYVIIASAVSGSGGSSDVYHKNPSSAANDFSSAVFSGVIGNEQTGMTAFFMFIFIILAVAVFFILIRKVNIWRAVAKFFGNLIDNILTFISNALYFNRNIEEKFVLPDYRDEEIKLEPSETNKKSIHGKGKLLYKDFIYEMESLPDETKRLQYSYQTLISCWKSKYRSINASSTPHEIEIKMRSVGNPDEIEAITGLFEKYKYAEDDIPPLETRNAVEAVCHMLRAYLD